MKKKSEEGTKPLILSPNIFDFGLNLNCFECGEELGTSKQTILNEFFSVSIVGINYSYNPLEDGDSREIYNETYLPIEKCSNDRLQKME